MKKVALLLCALLSTCGVMAQSEVEDDVYAKRADKQPAVAAAVNDTVKANAPKGAFFIQIPQNLRIKDNVYVQNRSPYFVLQMLVAVDMVGNGDFVPIGQTSYLPTGRAVKVASYDDNNLRKLRGKTLMIKVKGAKVNPASSGAQVDVYTPYGSVNVDNRKVDMEVVKNIKPEDVTYDFHAHVFEQDHDLYIQLEGKDMLDF